MTKQRVFDAIEGERDDLVDLADRIWETPELGLHEEESAAALIEKLEAAGFEVETGVGGMPTAFVASAGEGSPTVGILGEYDALPGLSQRVSAERDPIEDGAPGHGCGHNLFGTAGAGAAIGVKEALEADGRPGTIRFYGCPAEEILVGKVYMARDGAFDDLDAAIAWHPSGLTRATRGRSLALDSVQYTFHGESAHAAASPESGRSALDAIELMNTGVEYMREHVPDEARVHYSITDGGDAPNVVPAEASVWYYVRAPRRETVERIGDWLDEIAEGAAMMTQTDLSRRFLTGCYDFRPNEVITDVIRENLRAVDPIDYDDEDREFAAELQSTFDSETLESSLDDIAEADARAVEGESLYPEPVESTDAGEYGGGSTDVGDVSWITPTGQFRAATWPVGTPAHTWQAVAANGSFGVKGMVFAAKVLGGTAYDLVTDEDTVAAATEEFESLDEYETPLPPDAEPPFEI